VDCSLSRERETKAMWDGGDAGLLATYDFLWGSVDELERA